MDDFPQMLYRAPGPHAIHGHMLSTLVVQDAGERDAAFKDGWHASTIPPAQVEPVADDDAPPTRQELEQRAKAVGLTIDKRWSDKRLLAELSKG